MLQIIKNTSLKEILDYISKIREKKEKEKEVLAVIEKALFYGHDFIINLFWEKALTFQHLVMVEEAKGENKNLQKKKVALLEMEKAINETQFFIEKYKLVRWEHRLFRFLGRLADYKRDFKRAVLYYKKSIKVAKKDPEYLEKKFPRWLEVEGFLSYSLIMSGQVERGYKMALNVYAKFDKEKEAKALKKDNYTTWAIWRTGIPLRTINALIDKKFTFDKKGALEWLSQSESILNPAESMKLWTDFKYRKDEIKYLLTKLKEVN